MRLPPVGRLSACHGSLGSDCGEQSQREGGDSRGGKADCRINVASDRDRPEKDKIFLVLLGPCSRSWVFNTEKYSVMYKSVVCSLIHMKTICIYLK